MGKVNRIADRRNRKRRAMVLEHLQARALLAADVALVDDGSDEPPPPEAPAKAEAAPQEPPPTRTEKAEASFTETRSMAAAREPATVDVRN